MKPTLPITPSLVNAHWPRFIPILERKKREQKLHPTLLVTGLEGVGKRSLSLHFIQYLFCDSPQEFNACGQCKSCKQALQNQWFDLFWLEPETGNDETKIGHHRIDSFREIKSKLGMGPIEEPYKIVVISDADRMTPQASNSILKTLEEPPPNWIFILTAADSSRLLPTILSRCMEIRLNPLQPDQIFSALREIKASEFNSDRAKFASRAAQGSLSRALQFLNPEVWDMRNLLLGYLTHPAKEWMPLVDRLSSSQREMSMGLDLLESIFHDLLQFNVKNSRSDWAHEDQKEFLIQWYEKHALNQMRILSVLDSIAEKRRFVPMTLNAKLLAQEILNPLLETILS